MTLIALSASYGALGSRIGEELGARFDVPFVDRALALAVAGRLDVSVGEALDQWEPPRRGYLERALRSFLDASHAAPVGLPAEIATPADFHAAAEAAVRDQAATGQGVILGRGAVATLRGDPRVLRVRLTGPAERRLRQAIAFRHVDEEQARSAMRRLDRFHADYIRQYYGVDIDDPALYHLTVDTTAFGVEASVGIIAAASAALR